MERYVFMHWQDGRLKAPCAFVSPAGEILAKDEDPQPDSWMGLLCGKTLFAAAEGTTDEVIAKVRVGGRVATTETTSEIWEDVDLIELRAWDEEDDLRVALDLAEHANRSVTGDYDSRETVQSCLGMARSFIETGDPKYHFAFTYKVVELLKAPKPVDPMLVNLHLVVGSVHAIAFTEGEACREYLTGCIYFASEILGFASAAKYANESMDARYKELSIIPR